MRRMIDGDAFVRLVNLPFGVHGCVTPNDDGTFSIYLNARDSRAKNREAFDHERGHIVRDDFYNDRPIEEVES